MSDRLKNRVYRAEHRLGNMFDMAREHRVAELYGQRIILPDERRFGALETVQAYADWVVDFMADDYPAHHAVVKVGHGNLKSHAYWQEGEIHLPQPKKGNWAWREIVVLHELAHHFTPEHEHDETFITCLNYLFDKVIGPEAGWAHAVLLHSEGINLAKENQYV